MRYEMAFDLMGHVWVPRGAKRRQIQIYLSDYLFIFGDPTYALSRRLASILVLRRVARSLLKLSQLRGLALGCSWLELGWQSLRSADLAARESQLPAGGPRQGGGGGSAGGEGQKIGNLLLGPAGPNTQAKKNPAKAQLGAQKKH